ncbi:MAG: hypothetical protein PHI68_03905 [Candidatus Cloacimonetes bacterium]|nr:hypothetical protein [Candidatus Cloacimonadota bacterium]
MSQGRLWQLLLICLVLGQFQIVSGQIYEASASAAALNGLYLLSDSVADYQASPLIRCTGFASTFQKPYSISELAVYGVHAAFRNKLFGYGLGSSFLSHPQYQYQDTYLNANLGWGSYSFGATHHIIFEEVISEDICTYSATDLGINHKSSIPVELIINNAYSRKALYSLSAGLVTGQGSCLGMGFSTDFEGSETLRIGSTFQPLSGLKLICSWQNNPSRMGIGSELAINKLNLLYAVRTHQELMLTHCIDLRYDW